MVSHGHQKGIWWWRCGLVWRQVLTLTSNPSFLLLVRAVPSSTFCFVQHSASNIQNAYRIAHRPTSKLLILSPANFRINPRASPPRSSTRRLSIVPPYLPLPVFRCVPLMLTHLSRSEFRDTRLYITPSETSSNLRIPYSEV